MSGEFYTVTNTAASYTSRGIQVDSAYSIQVNVTGTTFNVDVKLQTSIDNQNWVDITGASEAAITADKTIMFDISVGSHAYSRVVVTRNSGDYTSNGLINSGTN